MENWKSNSFTHVVQFVRANFKFIYQFKYVQCTLYTFALTRGTLMIICFDLVRFLLLAFKSALLTFQNLIKISIKLN